MAFTVTCLRMTPDRDACQSWTAVSCFTLLGERNEVLSDPACAVREEKIVSNEGNHHFFALCIGYAPEGLPMACKEVNERHPAGSFVPVVKRVS